LTTAADLGVDDLICHFLLGHAPKGISQKYIATLILANGPKMRKEQSRMSASFLRLLGLDLKGLQKAIEDALAQSREAGPERARAAAMVLQGQRTSARARRGKRSGARMPRAA
jgi:hypothetical protein